MMGSILRFIYWLFDQIGEWLGNHERLFWGSLMLAEAVLVGLILWGWWRNL